MFESIFLLIFRKNSWKLITVGSEAVVQWHACGIAAACAGGTGGHTCRFRSLGGCWVRIRVRAPRAVRRHHATALLRCRRHSQRALEAARCMPACIVSWSGRRMLTGRGRSLQRFWLTLLYKATASKIHKLRMFSSSEIFTDYRRLLRGNRRRPLTAVLWPDLEW